MRFYTRQHKFYCGIDLHARSMYVCILNQEGVVLVHRNIPSDKEAFLKIIAPYREDLAVAVECIFTWYGFRSTSNHSQEVTGSPICAIHRESLLSSVTPST